MSMQADYEIQLQPLILDMNKTIGSDEIDQISLAKTSFFNEWLYLSNAEWERSESPDMLIWQICSVPVSHQAVKRFWVE